MEIGRIYPMPNRFGAGFVSDSQLPEEDMVGYRCEHIGRYHNYHFTPERWQWPVEHEVAIPLYYKIDAFSPNLNKELHVGHLRQLALAKSLSAILKDRDVKFVALLGCSLGVTSAALDGWEFWCQKLDYAPHVYYDVTLPWDAVETRTPREDEDFETVDGIPPQLWDGPNGPVVVKTSGANSRRLYSYYDLVFAKRVAPTHYITGQEQREHFSNLGLGEKHLPMGLVLGSDGKKLKSRTGDALLATEAMDLVMSHLRDLPMERAWPLAWNILAWNFLHATRETNLKFEPEKWVRPDSPGMYVSYTYARIQSAFKEMKSPSISVLWSQKEDLTESDLKILGVTEYFDYYCEKSVQNFDPSPLANYTHDLARLLNTAYERERIRGGREIFAAVMFYGLYRIRMCLDLLGMFRVNEI